MCNDGAWQILSTFVGVIGNRIELALPDTVTEHVPVVQIVMLMAICIHKDQGGVWCIHPGYKKFTNPQIVKPWNVTSTGVGFELLSIEKSVGHERSIAIQCLELCSSGLVTGV